MDTVIGLFAITLFIWAIGFGVSTMLALPICLLTFGFGFTAQGMCIGMGIPYVVSMVAPIPILVSMLIIDEVQQNNRAYSYRNRF